MNASQIRKLLDCCFIAKRITETMEELPKGFKPRHIHVIECVYTLGEKQGEVCVSDVSRELNITTPSITKLINELEEMHTVEKYSAKGDKRVALLRLTNLGLQYQKYYVADYHDTWAKNLQSITDEQVKIVVQVISKLQAAMPKNGGTNE